MIYSQLAALPELSQLTSLKRDQQANPDQDLGKVARQFESIFTHMMIKSMRQASLGNELFKGNGYETYRDMFDQQIAQTLAQGKGLGIAEAMMRQMKPQTAQPAAEAAAETQGLAGPKPMALKNSGKQAAAKGFGIVHAPSPELAMRNPLRSIQTDDAEPSQAVTTRPARSNEVLRIASVQQHTRPGTPEDFIASVWPAAKRIAGELGVSPRVLVAQAALETGWGRHMPKQTDGQSSQNYFGIKTHDQWQGRQVAANTTEVINGQQVNERANFRAYDSIEASFRDFAHFLKTNPRYEGALSVAHDAEKFVESLQKAGYATDPMYADKLKSIMNGRRMNLMVAQLDPSEETTQVG